MHHSHMPGEGIVPAECFLLSAQVTAHFLLARIVYCVFVSREVVGPREDGVAGLAGRWINAVAFVWASLRVAEKRR